MKTNHFAAEKLEFFFICHSYFNFHFSDYLIALTYTGSVVSYAPSEISKDA